LTVNYLTDSKNFLCETDAQIGRKVDGSNQRAEIELRTGTHDFRLEWGGKMEKYSIAEALPALAPFGTASK